MMDTINQFQSGSVYTVLTSCVIAKVRLILLARLVSDDSPVYGDKALFSRRSLPAALHVQWRYVYLSQ